jgi:hypothetical protein
MVLRLVIVWGRVFSFSKRYNNLRKKDRSKKELGGFRIAVS